MKVPLKGAAINDSHMIGIGSLIHELPARYEGTVWTTGLIGNRKHLLPRARVLALRGELTRRLVAPSNNDVVLGDGGLLVSKLWPAIPKRYKLGIIPHYVDYAWTMEHCLLANLSSVLVLDLLQ